MKNDFVDGKVRNEIKPTNALFEDWHLISFKMISSLQNGSSASLNIVEQRLNALEYRENTRHFLQNSQNKI